MKTKYLRKNFQPGRLLVSAFTFITALFVLAASTLAQVQPDKLRTVPTEEGVATSEFLIATSHTANSGNINTIEDGNEIGSMPAGGNAWIEYQVVAPEGGELAAVLTAGTARVGSQINVTFYKTETETWVRGGTTLAIAKNGWGIANGSEYIFPVSLEAGIVYTMRVSFETAGCNLYAVSFIKTVGSTDATLSDIKVNGASLADFDPANTSYTLALPPNTWIAGIEGTANDANATVENPEIGDPIIGKSSFAINVTSESGIATVYTVNVTTPVLVDEGVSLALDGYFYSNGVNASATKVNNMNNNDYIEYYVYTEYDENVEMTLLCGNGYDPSNSYLNVSALGINDTTWVLNDIYTKRIPTTYDESMTTQWGAATANEISFVFPMKAEQPTLIRIYSITDKGNAADIHGMSFKLLFESIDATLSDLQVDGATVPGFDPNKTSYAVPLPAGASSVSLAATANDGGASVEEGIGSLAITGFKTSDTITVTSASGFSIDYKLHFYTPLELAFTEDTLSVMMGDWVYMNGGVNATNERINSINNEEYVEYYLYSASDKDVHLILNVACGNVDTTYAKINVSTYAPGSEWTLDEAKTLNIPGQGLGAWAVEFASEVKYNLSLKAGEAVVLRVYGITNGAGAGDIYSAKLVEGKTSYGTAIETAYTSAVKVWGAQGYLNVRCDEAFVGGTVQIYDLSGRLVKDELIDAGRNAFKVERNGLYLVKLVSTSNAVQTVKCIVR